MVSITVVDRSGNEHQIESRADISVMEAIRDFGLDEMLALCGGCCSCATCHVYVDESFGDRLMTISADESDLLDSSEHRTAKSRLACQLRMSYDLQGLRVVIAPED